MKMTFSDIFKSSFLENISAVSVLDMVLALLLSFGIGLEILEDEICIGLGRTLCIKERVVQIPEKLRIVRAVSSVYKLHQDFTDVRILVEDHIGIISAVLLVINDLIGRQSEDEDIILSDLFIHLDVCTIHSAYGNGTV